MSVMKMMMSRCFLMFLWSLCVKASDLTSLNISDTNTTSPCLIQIGDVPYTKCDPGKDVYNSTTEHNTVPWTTNTSPQTQSTSHTDRTTHRTQDDRRNTTASIRCPSDPCADLQMTCTDAPERLCRCSHVTSDVLSVDVQALTHSVARVQWCAYYSPALEYVVVFSRGGLSQKTLRLSSAARRVFVSELTAEHVYHVCVFAVQRKNTSAPKCTSVLMDINTEPYLYILTVMCVILILTVMTQTFCLIKLCRKQPAENPHLTRLISIPNPAFYNP